MKYFLLEPEVAGGLGENSVLDHSVKPFIVKKLHYEFAGWLGDDLLETHPCFIATSQLLDKLSSYGFTGYTIDDVETSTTYEFRQFYPDRILPEFKWLKVHGKAARDDFGLSETRRLVVSEKALDVLKSFKINNCDIDEYEFKIEHDLETLLAECKTCAEKYGKGLMDGDSLQANLNYNKLDKLLKKIRQFGDEGSNAIMSLTEEQGQTIRCWAATHSLKFNERKAKKVLKKLSKEKGIIAFNAKMVLQEWKKGNLRNI